jgi:ABC-type multidrug transport system ATPase subunit
MSTATPAVRTEELTKHFRTTVAVSDLSLTVPPGEVFGLLGANGAGRSTTVRMLLGLLRPSAGTAETSAFLSVKRSTRTVPPPTSRPTSPCGPA